MVSYSQIAFRLRWASFLFHCNNYFIAILTSLQPVPGCSSTDRAKKQSVHWTVSQKQRITHFFVKNKCPLRITKSRITIAHLAEMYLDFIKKPHSTAMPQGRSLPDNYVVFSTFDLSFYKLKLIYSKSFISQFC